MRTAPISSACLRLRRRRASSGSGGAMALRSSDRTQRRWPNGCIGVSVQRSMRRPRRPASYGCARLPSRTTIPRQRPTCARWRSLPAKMQPRLSAKPPSANLTTFSPYSERPAAAARASLRSEHQTPGSYGLIRARPLTRCPRAFGPDARRSLSCSIGTSAPAQSSAVRSSAPMPTGCTGVVAIPEPYSCWVPPSWSSGADRSARRSPAR